jgi:hypothetical protein
MIKRMTLALVAGGGLLAGAGAATGVSVAARAPEQPVYSCVSKPTGKVRLVASSVKCKPGERRVSWLKDGPEGTWGPEGVRGPRGVDGREGADGRDGAPGPQGPKGDTGPRGPQGPKGPDGPAGDPGPKGADGKDGKDGRTGKDGRDGKDGKSGAAGFDVVERRVTLKDEEDRQVRSGKCPEGTKAMGGGFSSSKKKDVFFQDFMVDNNEFLVDAYNDTGGNVDITVSVTCAPYTTLF